MVCLVLILFRKLLRSLNDRILVLLEVNVLLIWVLFCKIILFYEIWCSWMLIVVILMLC